MRDARTLRTLRVLLVSAIVGVLAGLASALFLVALDRVTGLRLERPRLLYGLPIAGLVVGVFLDRFGAAIRGGNDLVIDTIHDGGPEIPLRMAPIVLVGTLVTHLFGGSAGREGTAVQMGASLADFVAHRLRIGSGGRRALLAAGVAGGFGSVFGTPIAGAVFGLEFIVRGRIEYRALAPAVVAALVGDATTRALGVVHTTYPIVAPHALTPSIAARWLVVSVAVALTAIAFVELTHAIKARATDLVPSRPLRMALGGATVVALALALGTDRYLGLGVPTITASFESGSIPTGAFALKLLFTAITIGSGFLGGEVTPLFFVGATLGHVLALALGLPLPLTVATCLAAVFATASRAPIALSILAVELFGAAILPHVVLVSVAASLMAGDRSLYTSQRGPTKVGAR